MKKYPGSQHSIATAGESRNSRWQILALCTAAWTALVARSFHVDGGESAGRYTHPDRASSREIPTAIPVGCRVGIFTRNCRRQRDTRLTQFPLPPKSIKQLPEGFPNRPHVPHPQTPTRIP